MPCYTRMKAIYLRGLLWLYLLSCGYMVLSVEPGFLDFDNLPDTNFSCVGKVIGGYYADLETNCQMFHVCTIGQLDEPMDIRFLCLNGTVFDQETRVCERIDEVDCSKSEKFYSLNLELYGNTQPSIAEDNADTDPPIIIKASTTTTTTTTTQKPTTKTTKPTFFTTAAPTVTTVTKVISAHHFPISNGPDIRFNPEEINISLNPGSPPSVRSKTVSYQQQVFNSNDNNKKVVVTTHTSYGSPEKEDFVKILPNTQRPQVASTQKVQSPATPVDINYGFTYHQTEQNNHQDYTEQPHNFHYQHSYSRQGQFRNQFKTTTYRTEHLPTTRKHPYTPNKQSTTYRTPYVSSVKAPTYHTYRTEKPQRLQLPLPLLPTLPPLSFSSPAPFSLGHHIETKRYSDHQTPPRIIISASASVSDNSGRRLNYSLGTIGVSPLLEEPPKSYDEYKDHDVVLDPFYHDVPKIKNSRRKRQVTNSNANSEQAAVDVLKFLFDWYSTHQKTSTVKVPIDLDDITEINQELAPIIETPISEIKNKSAEELVLDFQNSALFNKKSKFNIIGDILSVTEQQKGTMLVTPTPVTLGKLETVDYVDDNYEAVEQRNNTQIVEEKVVDTGKVLTEITTIPPTTLPPTTTTTEPTTTSRIMAIMRKRARVHHNRILNENRRRYIASLNALKPKIRRRGKELTAEEHKMHEVIISTIPPEEAKSEIMTTHQTRSKPESTKYRQEFAKSLDDNDQLETNKDSPQISETTSKVTMVTVPADETKTKISQTHQTIDKFLDDNDQVETNKDSSQIFESTTGVSTSITTLDEAEAEVSTYQTISSPKSTEYLKEFAKTLDDNNQTESNKEVSQISDSSTKVTTLTIAPDEAEEILTTTQALKRQLDDEFAQEFTENASSNNQTVQFSDKSTNVDSERDQLNEETIISDSVETTTSSDFTEELDSSQDITTISDGLPSTIFNKETNPSDSLTKTESTVEENLELKSDESETELGGSEKEVISQIPENELNSTTTDNEEYEDVEEENYETETTQVDNNLDYVSEPKNDEESNGTTLETNIDEDNGEVDTNLEKETNVTELPDINEEYTKSENFDFETDIPVTTTEPTEHVIEDNKVSLTQESDASTTTNYTTQTVDEKTQEAIIPVMSSSTESYKQTTSNKLYQTIATESSDTTTDIFSTPDSEMIATNLTPVEITTTEISINRSRSRNNNRRVRPYRTRTSSSYKRPNSRHRFSSTEITSRPTRRKSKIEDTIIETITTQLTPTESLIKEEIYSTSPTIPTTTVLENFEEVPATDAPLYKSANPTQAETTKESLHTTPLSMIYKYNVRKEKLRSYIFNCFGKVINKFYSDPRDCRLFHYCTSGYHKNQLLDMKFVCDLGTYFDEEKLICTKTKPERCL